MLDIQKVICGSYAENAYIVSLKGQADAFVIDPGDDYPALVRALATSKKSLSAICLTHAHFDHMLAAPGLIADTGAKLYVSAADIPALNDETLNLYKAEDARLPATRGLSAMAYAAEITLAGIHFEVLSTPGHTPGGVCLYAKEHNLLFSGDTLFQASFGRVDLAGGSAAQMRRSLRQLFTLPGETRVLPGHEGETTIARERARYGMA